MNYSLKNDKLTVTVSDRGAELQSILGADGTEYLWQGHPAYWRDRAINLFPCVARLTEGRYFIDGKEYSMPAHGYAPHWPFTVVEHTENKLVFRTESDEETYKMYPRKYVFDVEYVLLGDKLEITFRVENKDEKIMYFGLGGHPGINVPLEQGKKFEDYSLCFDKAGDTRQVMFNDKCFRTGEIVEYALDDGKIHLRHDLFDNDAIVLVNSGYQVRIAHKDGGRGVTVEYPGMEYIGFWHWVKSETPYVCVEPWCSLPGVENQVAVFEEREDLLRLEPGKTYVNTWTMTMF